MEKISISKNSENVLKLDQHQSNEHHIAKLQMIHGKLKTATSQEVVTWAEIKKISTLEPHQTIPNLLNTQQKTTELTTQTYMNKIKRYRDTIRHRIKLIGQKYQAHGQIRTLHNTWLNRKTHEEAKQRKYLYEIA